MVCSRGSTLTARVHVALDGDVLLARGLHRAAKEATP